MIISLVSAACRLGRGHGHGLAVADSHQAASARGGPGPPGTVTARHTGSGWPGPGALRPLTQAKAPRHIARPPAGPRPLKPLR
jgi:hypothetical protein